MPASSAPNPQLVVETGRLRGASFEVPPGRSEIGRQAGVAILLDDQDVSRRHAVLERSGGRVVLTDPGSTNGTWVNRRQLRAGDPRDRVELRDGDELRLGSVTLRFSTAAAGDGTAVREDAPGDAREVLGELTGLREALAGLRLTEAERSSAEQDLAAMREAVDRPDPDTTAAGRHLQSFTANLKEAGALATAGVALAESIAKIAHWLGPLGAAALALL